MAIWYLIGFRFMESNVLVRIERSKNVLSISLRHDLWSESKFNQIVESFHFHEVDEGPRPTWKTSRP